MDFQKQTVDPMQVSFNTLDRSRTITDLLLTIDVTEVRWRVESLELFCLLHLELSCYGHEIVHVHTCSHTQPMNLSDLANAGGFELLYLLN